ncbi:hypothetical protein GCM10023194_78630 [Planotetraspora phitsanulokensis]|uniref:SnoaL-like domain-containing protein n=1 Tax=Planotetraspora phitsanulokensis TaxID=575192 RepID=A0A8J3XHE2_9ACTN|nr:hypothetical protein [Planotetraspora phitsanulokensis]GII41149.1 hypothetical protein Pph01_61520 [Planotetraspora phitsanulokensis]
MSTTAQTVRGYHDARFRGDVAAAAAYVAEPFSFRSPFISSTDPVGHLAGLPEFVKIVTDVDLISELYGEAEATLVYDVHTATPAGIQRTAEHFRLDGNGKITAITLIFDAAPWQPMAQLIT